MWACSIHIIAVELLANELGGVVTRSVRLQRHRDVGGIFIDFSSARNNIPPEHVRYIHVCC